MLHLKGITFKIKKNSALYTQLNFVYRIQADDTNLITDQNEIYINKPQRTKES